MWLVVVGATGQAMSIANRKAHWPVTSTRAFGRVLEHTVSCLVARRPANVDALRTADRVLGVKTAGGPPFGQRCKIHRKPAPRPTQWGCDSWGRAKSGQDDAGLRAALATPLVGGLPKLRDPSRHPKGLRRSTLRREPERPSLGSVGDTLDRQGMGAVPGAAVALTVDVLCTAAIERLSTVFRALALESGICTARPVVWSV